MEVKQIPLSKIRVGERSRKDMGDLGSLMRSMHKRGLINPITVDAEGNLICGERRLRSAQDLGWEEIDCHVVSSMDELLALHLEKEENECRLEPTTEEKVRIGLRIETLEKPKADANREEGQKKGGRGRKKTHASNDAQVSSPVHKSEVAAQQVGMSKKTYERARAVVSAADANPDNPAIQEAKEEMNATGKVYGSHQKVLGEVKEARAKKTKRRSDYDERRPHPASTMRAIEAIRLAVDQLEKMNVDLLKGEEKTKAFTDLSVLRGRISKLLNSMKD